MKKIGLSILTIGCLFMASGDAYGQVERCSVGPSGNGEEISVIRGKNTDGESFSCAGGNEGMRDCDALGYVQRGGDEDECPPGSERLTCPFDNSRFYCGGKISELPANKRCAMTLQVAGSAIGGTGGLGLPEDWSDCAERFSNIILYNNCITRLCPHSCAIKPIEPNKEGFDFCFNNYGQRVYKLTCDATVTACPDENDVQDEDTTPGAGN